MDAKTVSSILGHYSAGFTLDTYTQATAVMQQAAADKVGSFIAQAVFTTLLDPKENAD